jgi:hypothetical protein
MIRILLFRTKILATTFMLFALTQLTMAQLSENLLPNGDWESGAWPITKFIGGSAGTMDITTDARTGTNAGLITLTTAINNLNKTLVYSDTVKNGTEGQYLMTNYMKTNNGQPVFYALFQLNEAWARKNWVVFPKDTVKPGVDWEMHRRYFVPNSAYLENLILKIKVGEVAGEFYFDDATIQKIEEVLNPGFEDVDDYFFFWSIDTTQKDGAMAAFSQETTDVNSGSSALKVEVSAVSDTASQIAVASAYAHFVESGVPNYAKVNIKGTSDQDSIWANIRCFKMLADGGYAYSHSIADSFAISADWAEYTTMFTVPDTIAYVEYQYLLGNQTGTFLLDDLSTVSYIAPKITSDPVITRMVGALYEYQAVWEGSGTFTVSSIPEAAWLSVDENGLLSGTPDAVGEYGISLTLDDGLVQDIQSFTITVAGECSGTVVNDTTIYYVSNTEFESISPKTYFDETILLSTKIDGCDSIVHNYSTYVFEADYCTDTTWVKDTIWYNDTIYTELVDTTTINVFDSISVTDTLIIDVNLTWINTPDLTNKIKAYPNPTNNWIFVNSGDFALMDGCYLSIVNMQGISVYESLINQQLMEIDLSTLEGKGLYLLLLKDPDGNIAASKKILLE